MRIALRRSLAATLAAAGLAAAGLTGTATAAVAAPPGVPAGPAAVAAVPAYGTWIADVTAVTDQASRYLADRLPDPKIKPALVLDIDNTALESHYNGGAVTPATAPVLALARQAVADGATVFFVTARPEILRLWTEGNLRTVGYRWGGIYLRPTFNFQDNQTLKTNARIAIERRGYTIVANVGNSATDLGGGHAERTFKLPDYNGQLD